MILIFFLLLKLSGSSQSHFDDDLGKQNCYSQELSKKSCNNFIIEGVKGNLVSITSNKYSNPQEPITISVDSCPGTNFRALLLEAQSQQKPYVNTINLKHGKDYHQKSIRVCCGINFSKDVRFF